MENENLDIDKEKLETRVEFIDDDHADYWSRYAFFLERNGEYYVYTRFDDLTDNPFSPSVSKNIYRFSSEENAKKFASDYADGRSGHEEYKDKIGVAFDYYDGSSRSNDAQNIEIINEFEGLCRKSYPEKL